MMRKTLKRLLIVLLAIVSPAVLPLRAGAQNLDARALMRARQQGARIRSFRLQSLRDDGGGRQRGARHHAQGAPAAQAARILFLRRLAARAPHFAWTIDRDFNRVHPATIDTMLTDFRIDYPFYVKGAGDAAIGGLGQVRCRSTTSTGPAMPISSWRSPTTPIYTIWRTCRSTT